VEATSTKQSLDSQKVWRATLLFVCLFETDRNPRADLLSTNIYLASARSTKQLFFSDSTTTQTVDHSNRRVSNSVSVLHLVLFGLLTAGPGMILRPLPKVCSDEYFTN